MISNVCIDKKAVVKEYKRGVSISELARRYATTNKEIKKILDKSSVEVKSADDRDLNALILKYHKQGKDLKEIGELVKVSVHTVKDILNKTKTKGVEQKSSAGVRKEEVKLFKADYDEMRKMLNKGASKEDIQNKFNLSDKQLVTVMSKVRLDWVGNVKKLSPESSTSKVNASTSSTRKVNVSASNNKTKSSRLTNKEKEAIKKYVNEGVSQKEIARRLNRSIKTISKYISSISSNDVKLTNKIDKQSSKEHNPFFKSYAEKKQYLDNLYGEGCWKLLDRGEILKVLKGEPIKSVKRKPLDDMWLEDYYAD